MGKQIKLQVNKGQTGNYTSSHHLNNLVKLGAINVEVTEVKKGMHWCLRDYKFFTKDGSFIGETEKYHDYGFCSQAFGVKLSVTSLCPKRDELKYQVLLTDLDMHHKNPILSKINANVRKSLRS